MSDRLIIRNCDNIGNKWACLHMFPCLRALTSVREMRLQVRMMFLSDAGRLVCFLHVSASLVRKTPLQTIKHMYHPLYLEFEGTDTNWNFPSRYANSYETASEWSATVFNMTFQVHENASICRKMQKMNQCIFMSTTFFFSFNLWHTYITFEYMC